MIPPECIDDEFCALQPCRLHLLSHRDIVDKVFEMTLLSEVGMLSRQHIKVYGQYTSMEHLLAGQLIKDGVPRPDIHCCQVEEHAE
jgi:hypothetical protein